MKRLKVRKIKDSAFKLAGSIDKEDFLRQLKNGWYPHVQKDTPIEEEVSKALDRIANSGPFKRAFDMVGITEEDIRRVLTEIRKEKSVEIEVDS